MDYTLAISVAILVCTLTLYHGLHIEAYNFFYENSGFAGPKSFSERLKVVKDLYQQKDVFEPFWSPRAQVMKLWVSPLTPSMYVVSEATLARKILQDSTLYVRHERPSQFLKGLLDYALFILPTDGPYWKKHRKLLQPGFGPTHLRHSGAVTVKVVKKLERLWSSSKRMDDGKDITVNIKNVLGSMIMDIIAQVAFGYDTKMVDRLETEDDPKWEALEMLFSSGIINRRALIPPFLWSFFGVGSNNPKILAAKKELNDLLYKLASERRKAIADGKVGQEKWELDVLQRLLLSNDEGSFSEEELFGELLGFFLAGFETTANTLTFAILELCRNEDIQDKLYESIKDVVLSEQTDPLPIIDPTALKYLDNFLKEVQRRHSIVPRVPRKCTDHVDLQDHFVPRGSLISVYIKGIHLNPKYHPEPLKFNPDRFDNEIKPGTFLPFGDGPHMCIGFKMAVIEAKIILIKMVQNYKFTLVPGQTLREYVSITNSLKKGLFVKVSKRI